MLGFKTLHSTRSILAGIEPMHTIRKGQMLVGQGKRLSFADQVYALAG